MNSKECTKCGVVKPLGEFSPSKKNRDGRVSQCKACLRERAARGRAAQRIDPPKRHTAAVPAGTKWCPECGAAKPLNEFGRNKTSRDGLTSYCRPCHNAISRRNREAAHGSTRNYHLKRRYGITAAEFDAKVEEQGGLCALCREREPEHVDHDHLTGEIRGVLCSCCNQGLGNFRDSIATMRAAINYLETTTWQKTRVCPGVYRLTSPRPAARPSSTSSEQQHRICSLRAVAISRLG